MSERQIITPGEAPATAAPTRGKPGPKSKAEKEAAAAAVATGAPGAALADDDLAQYDTEELPEAPAAQFTPEQQAAIAQMIAGAVAAAKSSQDPKTAAKLAAAANSTERLPTQDAAMALQNDAVARGIRPRPILSADGWVTHSEMARVKGAPTLGSE